MFTLSADGSPSKLCSCAVPWWFHPPYSFAKPTPWFTVCYPVHANRSGQFGFQCSLWTFAVGWRIAHWMKKWRSFVLSELWKGPLAYQWMGPLCFTCSKAVQAEFPMAQQKPVGIPGLISLLCHVCTFQVTELGSNGIRPIGSFPTPTQLSIFSTVACLKILPAHSLETAISTIPLLTLQPSCKIFPCDEQEQEQVINTAAPQLLELCLHKFSLLAST